MALDIWVGDWNEHGSKLITSFDPEAYYKFLYPLFEQFETVCGQFICQYDGAQFGPSSLDQISKLIDQAEKLIRQQEEVFEVHMGTFLGTSKHPKQEEIYESVSRDDYLQFISEWRSALLKARQDNKPLLFYGD
ncbi:MAG: hypothetical protein AAF085_13185 [Planctomycetota bacterium]